MLATLLVDQDDRGQTIDALHEAIVRAYDTGQHPIMAFVMNHGVRVAVDLGAWELAATLGAAVTDGPLAGLTMLVHPAEHTDRQDALDQIRAHLGVDRYDVATTNAIAMTYPQVVQYALAELDRQRRTTDNAGQPRSTTSGRAVSQS